jgi:H+-transporting ATPase
MLTGESVPVEAAAGLQTYAGALVRRGEAVAEVTATAVRTKFGTAAELVRTAHVESTQQKTVLRIVENLAVFSGAMMILLAIYSHILGMGLGKIVPLLLTALLGAIPIGLPATLAAALGARELAKRHVLLTRLSAVDEAASI